MKILAEISDETLGLGEPEHMSRSQTEKKYRLEKSARAILLNAEGKMALEYLKTYDFHKLPGGGVEQGESLGETLEREILEEVGCKFKADKSLGAVIEYRNKFDLIYISYCFIAHVNGEVGEPVLDDSEIEEGHTTIWVKPKEAYEKIMNDKAPKYSAHFILERERAFLEEYLSNL